MNDLAARAPDLVRRYDELRAELQRAKRQRQEAAEYERSLRTRMEAMERGIVSAMVALGASKLEGPGFTLALQRTPDAVTVHDIDEVPEEYVREKIEKAVDKRAVAVAFKERGECIPGTEVTHGWRLRIK